ncbi:MAG TPA: SRPBCC family protein [Actinomycetota bacterium]|jgi:uncharacterized protein YndB with AHSA1/START domain|nr:SRPBCC family protein [Actinomycetota bacterium]
MKRSTATERTADREIVISREIDGPRDLVFEAFTDVSHLSEWWGPDGFTTTTHAFEFRPGGVWEFTMHGPDGIDYPNRIEWLEIVPPERIVLAHGKEADDPEAFVSTVTIADIGERSEIVLRSVFATREQRDDVVERHGAIEGGKQTLGRLAAYVATVS